MQICAHDPPFSLGISLETSVSASLGWLPMDGMFMGQNQVFGMVSPQRCCHDDVHRLGDYYISIFILRTLNLCFLVWIPFSCGIFVQLLNFKYQPMIMHSVMHIHPSRWSCLGHRFYPMIKRFLIIWPMWSCFVATAWRSLAPTCGMRSLYMKTKPRLSGE